MQDNDLTIEGTGQLHAEISRALVKLHKECLGKGPTKARTYTSGNLLVCVLEGGFLKGERTLRDAGRQAVVSEQRGQLQDVLRQRFVDTVEGLTERKVVTFISGVDLETEVSAEVFVLEPEPGPGSESHAVSAWRAGSGRFSRRRSLDD